MAAFFATVTLYSYERERDDDDDDIGWWMCEGWEI